MKNTAKRGQIFDSKIPSVWTVDDVVKFTTYSKNYIYKLVYSNKIPGVLPKKNKKTKTFFDPVKVQNWLLEGGNE